MKIKKIVYIVAFVILFSIVLSGCSSKPVSIDEIKQRGYIVMTTNAELEPFEYRDGNEIVGIDIDISKAIADDLGVDLVVNDVSFDALIFELKANKCDFVAAGISYDIDKARNVSFSVPYFFNAYQAIIVRSDSDINSASDIYSKSIGVQLGTTSDTYCTENLKSANVIRYNKSVDAISDLINGKIDAVVVDDFPAIKFVEKNKDTIKIIDEPLTTEKYMICVNKHNEELLNSINSTITKLQQNGKLDEIVEKYYKTTK